MLKQVFVFVAIGFAALAAPVQAQEAVQGAEPSREVRAEVISIDAQSEENGIRQVVFTARDKTGNTYVVDTASSFTEGLRYDIEPGMEVILQLIPDADDGYTAHLSDVVRTGALAWLAGAFALIVIAVGAWRGVFALLGLATTLGVLFLFILPQILSGGDPVTVTVIGAAAILLVNMHLAHGFSKTTFTAFLATLAGLALAWAASWFAVGFAHLSGLASEEAVFVYWRLEGIDPTGLLLAGFILGAVGVLDDIAVTQGEIVQELRGADPGLSRRELFVRAMRVGRHHIASVVNTLVLAYAGVAMPLFLLFMISSAGTQDFINLELVAEEIVRTLSGTVALVLTVPIATALATRRAPRKDGT